MESLDPGISDRPRLAWPWAGLIAAASLAWAVAPASLADEFRASPSEARAIDYLSREVPRWMRENRCFSCHNNGDAARALYQARALGVPIPDEALADTTAWLERPEGWARNGGEEAFSDKILSRIQVAAALQDAVEAGRSTRRDVLVRAAELVAADQRPDGGWRVDAEGNVGSPATYGPALATAMARNALVSADPGRFARQIDRAGRWLREARPGNVLDAAAVLLALDGADDPEGVAQRSRCLEVIRRGEASGGGWGPFANAPPEPFDTAVVLLALARSRDGDDREAMLGRGRASLLESQRPDGSWPETTRPAGGESYAQRLSTTGWVLQAILATRGVRPRAERPVIVAPGPETGG